MLIRNVSISRNLAMFVVTALLSLVTINVLLLKQNYELKSSARTRRSPSRDDLKLGVSLPSLIGIGANGVTLAFNYSQASPKSLILIFAPGCKYCEDNMSSWKALTEVALSSKLRVVGVSLVFDGAYDYLAKYQIYHVPIISKFDSEIQRSYKLGRSPQTLVVSGDGKVIGVYNGILNNSERKEIEELLDL